MKTKIAWLVLTYLALLAPDAMAFYNPHIGRWVNRDPIGEEGGLNMYVVIDNDAVNYWDYLGLISEEKCKELVGRAPELSKNIKTILEYLDGKDGCKRPTVICSCCDGKSDSSSKWSGRYYGGTENTVYLCPARLKDAATFLQFYYHELIHAKQDCDKFSPGDSCAAHACREIQAYLNDGSSCKDRKGAAYKECIIQAAANSAQDNCASRAEAEKHARAQYSKCSVSIWPEKK